MFDCRKGFVLAVLSGMLVGHGAQAQTVIDQQQPFADSWVGPSLNFLAQSFTPTMSDITGAAVYFVDPAGLNPPPGFNPAPSALTISLWTGLPGYGGSMELASGSGMLMALDGGWLETSWNPVSVTPNVPLYLVFTNYVGATVAGLGLSESVAGHDYAGGHAYMGSGQFNLSVGQDFAFRTYATAPVPEPASWLLLGLGMSVLALRTLNRDRRA